MATAVLREMATAAPQILDPVVRRPRLERLLADGGRRPVTLVCAPPGSGKTTLLTTCFADMAPGATEWVTAGADDDDGNTELLERAFANGPRVLVVDDAHHLGDTALGRLSQLIDRSSSSLDFVLAARADPPLGLARLRLQSRLREIRGAALAFTPDEAAVLLDRHGMHLRPADVVRLHACTEGWAAGLRLMLYALERGATASDLAEDENAAQAAASDYLLAEVLERESPELRRFLLRTSITERLTPDLAVLLSDDPHGGSRLEDLHRRGVFVVALDHGWYRYHALFAALLRARLRVEDPTLVTDLHRSAATWFAARDLRPAAEAHARAGEHWTLLGDLLRRRWRRAVMAGDFGGKFTDGLPEPAFRADPFLGLLAAAEDPAVVPAPRPVGPKLAEEVAILARLRACASGVTDAPPPPFTGQDFSMEPVLAVLDAELQLAAGDVEAAIRTSSRLAGEPGSWVERDAKALLALALAISGQVGDATRLTAELGASEAIRAARGRIAADAATVATAVCDIQAGRPVMRADLAAVATTTTSWSVRLCARTMLSVTRSIEAVHGFDPALARSPLAGRLFVAAGVLDVVDATGSRVLVGGEEEGALRRAREGLASGAPHGAAAAAALALARPDAHPRTATEAAVLLAVASGLTDDETAANAALTRAFLIAEGTRAWAPFTTHSTDIVDRVDALARRPGPHQSAAIEVLDLIRPRQAMVFVETLTTREATVLRLLPTLMSNIEIAAAMHLSVNTVKSHLKALYRKLAVDRRREAVMRARELGLL